MGWENICVRQLQENFGDGCQTMKKEEDSTEIIGGD